MEADDMDAIQKLFNKFCDEDGLMTKASLVAMPPFSDMLVSSAQEASLV
jgi:Ca2+-binding EF-hand superfamily protein